MIASEGELRKGYKKTVQYNLDVEGATGKNKQIKTKASHDVTL